MNTTGWKDVKAHLRTMARPAEPRNAEDFWSDFKAHASLVRQDEPLPARAALPGILGWSATTALALVLIVAGLWILPSHPAAATQIKALEVVAPHSGVIIMNDESGRGTILWITGMESKT